MQKPVSDGFFVYGRLRWVAPRGAIEPLVPLHARSVRDRAPQRGEGLFLCEFGEEVLGDAK